MEAVEQLANYKKHNKREAAPSRGQIQKKNVLQNPGTSYFTGQGCVPAKTSSKTTMSKNVTFIKNQQNMATKPL